MAVGQFVGSGVTEAESAIHVVEEGEQFGGGVETGEGFVLGTSRLELLELVDDALQEVRLVDLAAVAVLRVEDVTVLALAELDPLHELEKLVALLDVVVGSDRFEREQTTAAHAEADRTDRPVVHGVDLGTDFAPRRGADVQNALGADLVGGHAQDLGPPVELVHEGEDLVLLPRDHA